MLSDQDSTRIARNDEDNPRLRETVKELPLRTTTDECFLYDQLTVRETSINSQLPSPTGIRRESIETRAFDIRDDDSATRICSIEKGNICQLSSSSTTLTNNTIPVEHSLHNFVLVWLNLSMDESDDVFRKSVTHLQSIVTNINMFTNAKQCFDFLRQIKDVKVLMIISGDACEIFVSEVHNMTQIYSIYLFFGNIIQYEASAKSWSKVKGAFTEIISLCNSLKETTDQFEDDSVPVSVVLVDTTSTTNIDELDASFMYTQLLKEILLEIEYDENSVKDFVGYCRKLYAKDSKTLETITMFEQEYDSSKAIWWYTYECFLYRMANKALRNLEVNNLIKLGFFIRDLHRQLEIENKKQFIDKQIKTLTVYRGQSVSNVDFEKILKASGGLISFNNFLSTSVEKKVSLGFGKNATKPGFVGILFEMTIDTSITSSPFALLDDLSYFKDTEKEILFSTHAVFRIKEIKPIVEGNLRWHLLLSLTHDKDPQLNAVTQCMRKETEGSTGWHRLGILLVIVGEYNMAEDVYKELLNQMDISETEQAYLNHQLGWTKVKQGNYEEALRCYEKARAIREKVLPLYHSDFVDSYNHIGEAYKGMGNYTEALSHYEKALQICEKNPHTNKLQLAICNNNIGDLYNDMTEYSKAVSYYKIALEMSQEILPPNHPNLATSNNNIGNVYSNMGEYSEALPYYKKVLEISQKTLPSNHPDLATYHSNIGVMYDNIGDYAQALAYYEKALENSKDSLSENHPCLISFYNNIGLVYCSMGDFSKALPYLQNALVICKNSLPENHPSLATSYNNIGMVYLKRCDYSEALAYYEKDLEISSKNLPPNHLDLGPTFNSIGQVYFEMGQYSKALPYYEKALEICEKGLPANHPILAKCYRNIGSAYSGSSEYSKALSYLQKALEIQEKNLPQNLPDLASTCSRFGLLHKLMGQHSEAFLYYERAVDCAQKSLPIDHPDLQSYKKNLEDIKDSQ